MQHVFKYIFRVLIWLLAGVVILLIAGGLLLQTGLVKKRLAAFAVHKADAYINGGLTIGKIEGNFFTDLSLHDVRLINDSDTVAAIRTFSVRYKLWTLLFGRLELEELFIDRPFLYLEQLNDSAWNIQHIVKKQAAGTIQDTTGTNNFSVKIINFLLKEGTLKIQAKDTLIPALVNQLNTRAAFEWSDKRQELQLKEFSLHTEKPEFTVGRLHFNLLREEGESSLRDFYLKTSRNQINGAVNYDEQRVKESTAHIESDSLRLAEFEYFLPDLHFSASPVLLFDASLRKDSLRAMLSLDDEGQKISFELQSGNMMSWLSGRENTLLQYELNATVDNIELSHWLGQSGLNYHLNGTIKASGKGTDIETATLDLSGDFQDCTIDEKPVKQLSFDFKLEQGKLNGIAKAYGNFGSFELKPEIQNLTGEPLYNLQLKTRDLDLAPLTGIDSLQSNLNMIAKLSGQGFNPESLRAKAELSFSASQIQQVRLDTLQTNLAFERNTLQIDSLWVQSRSVDIQAQGKYSLDALSDLYLTAEFKNIDDLGQFVSFDKLQASGHMQAHLTGRYDSLSLNTTVKLDSVLYDNFILEEVALSAEAGISPSDTLLTGKLQAVNFRNESFKLDSVHLTFQASPDSVYAEAIVDGQDMRSELQTGIKPGQSVHIELGKCLIRYKDLQWELQQAPAFIQIDSTDFAVNNFRMVSEAADSLQYLAIDGHFSLNGQEDFRLEAGRIDISRIAELFQQNMDGNGFLDLNMHLRGTAHSPQLDGSFQFNQAVFNKYSFSDFSGKASYQQGILQMEAQLVPLDSGNIKLNGELPLQLRLDSMDFSSNPKDSVNLNLKVDRFPLAVLQSLNFAREIKGYLQGNIMVNGTVESPRPTGSMELKEASLNIPEYGLDYRDILFKLSILPDKIELDTFLIRSDDGTMVADGKIDFNSDFYKGDISWSKVKVKFDTFNPFDHPQFNMQLSGDATLGGTKSELTFDGDLKVPQAEIYLPALFSMMGKMNKPEIPKPVLVQEMERMGWGLDSLIQEPLPDINDSISFDYLNQLTGKLRVEIPKNTWIKNEDLRLELSGDLELLKHREAVEVFGTVDVVRGQYDLFGRTFVINSGNITFQGAEDLMPQMDIEASYVFRNADKAEQKLNVSISGKADSPEVHFKLDDNAISEGDALSYIIFGKGMNELTLDQQDNLAGAGGGNLAETAAASLLSAQITKYLGNKLNVDYIEVKSDGGFENATVVVGKYITNDLFVSYEQRFGETNEKNMAKYEVKLEYELFRFLFLQLNNSSNDSGFDVLFKFDSK